MKKNLALLCFVCFAFIMTKNSLGQTAGEYTLSLGGDDYFNVIKSDGSNGFYLVGSYGQSGNYDASYVHTSGATFSAYSYGSTGTEFGTYLTVLNDGNVLLTGRTNSFSSPPNFNVFLTKINPTNGVVIWSKSIGSDSTDLGYKAINSADGNILVTGPTGNSRTDMMVLKVDNNDGHVIFSRKIGFPYSNDVAFDIFDLGAANGIILLGSSGVGFFGMNEISLTLLDSVAKLKGVMFFGGSGDDEGRVFNTDINGFLYLAGSTSSYGAGQNDFFIIKLSTGSVPTVKWFKTYGGSGNDNLTGFVSNSQGFLLNGITSGFGSGGDGLIIQIDTAGQVIWSKNVGSTGGDYLQNTLVDLTNNLNLTAGYTNSFNGGTNNDGFLVVTDINGQSGTCSGNANITAQIHTIKDSAQFVNPIFTSDTMLVTQTNTGISAVSLTANSSQVCIISGISKNESSSYYVFPNPFSEIITITPDFASIYDIEVYDVNSKLVYKSNGNLKSVDINLTGLSSGVYILVCKDSNTLKRTKIVKY